MAYRAHTSARQKSGAIAAVIAIHAALLIAFLNISGVVLPHRSASALRIIDVSDVPVERRRKPPPPPPRKTKSNNHQRQKPSAGNRAAPRIATEKGPTDQSALEAANQPSVVTAPAAVASHDGAGTVGSGTAGGGGGGGGSGTGGGTGGIASPPRLQTPPLSSRDVANGHAREWPPGATIFLRLRIDNRGYIAECLVDRGSGVASIDGAICNLALDRLRFSPALNYHGEAVAGWFGYAQPAPR